MVPRVLGPLCEWETRSYEGIQLSQGDRELLDTLGVFDDGRLRVDELKNGVRVGATSWVGIVRLETLEIRIFPKLAGDRLQFARFLEFAVGVDGLHQSSNATTVRVAGDSLLDLVTLLFTSATEQVVRQGLMSGYIEREENLMMARGRILADRQILERFGQLDRIVCRFDEFDHDIDENRLLLVALTVARRRTLSSAVHRRVTRIQTVLEPVCDSSTVDLQGLRAGITYNRMNAHYEPAHRLAWLVLEGFGIDDLLEPGSTRSFAFLIDMNLLFERFVKRLVEGVLDRRRYRVDSQSAHGTAIWDATAGRTHSRIIPDLLVFPHGSPKRRLRLMPSTSSTMTQRSLQATSTRLFSTRTRSAMERILGRFCFIRHPPLTEGAPSWRSGPWRPADPQPSWRWAFQSPRHCSNLRGEGVGPIGSALRVEVKQALGV